jgi:hypothetical protein
MNFQLIFVDFGLDFFFFFACGCPLSSCSSTIFKKDSLLYFVAFAPLSKSSSLYMPWTLLKSAFCFVDLFVYSSASNIDLITAALE